MIRFGLGRLVVTRQARELLSVLDIAVALKRHLEGDWGLLPPDRLEANNRRIEQPHGRLLSRHTANAGQPFCVVTSSDRSATTVMLIGEVRSEEFGHLQADIA